MRDSFANMNDFTHIDYGVEAPALFSVGEFQQLVDTGIFEGSRVELAEGVIVRMSPAMPMCVSSASCFAIWTAFSVMG